jgi:integrase
VTNEQRKLRLAKVAFEARLERQRAERARQQAQRGSHHDVVEEFLPPDEESTPAPAERWQRVGGTGGFQRNTTSMSGADPDVDRVIAEKFGSRRYSAERVREVQERLRDRLAGEFDDTDKVPVHERPEPHPNPRQEEVKAMTAEQLTAFLSAAKRMPLPYGSVLWTLALTGMRFGEGLALQWQDVTLKDNTIRVQRSLSNGHLTTPKSGFGRDVEIGPQLARLLVRLRMHRAEQMKRHRWEEMPSWVFATASGGSPDPGRLRRCFRKCLKVAGLPLHFTPHSLRHTATRVCCSSAVSQRPGCRNNSAIPVSR